LGRQVEDHASLAAQQLLVWGRLVSQLELRCDNSSVKFHPWSTHHASECYIMRQHIA
jgi:hypothetical protein